MWIVGEGRKWFNTCNSMNLVVFMLLSGLIILCHRDPWLGCREKETNWPVVRALSHLALYSSSTDQCKLTLLIHSFIYLINIHISVTTWEALC